MTPIPRRRFAALLLLLLAPSCSDGPPPVARREATPVVVEVVRRGTHQPVLELVGTVRPFASISLLAPGTGTLELPERFATGLRTGAVVEEGEALATVRDDGARLRLAEARVEAEYASGELERTERSASAGLVTEDEMARAKRNHRLARERLEAAERALVQLAVRSPAAGRLVVERTIAPGQRVTEGTELGSLAAAGPLRVEASVPAASAAELSPGLAVELRRAGDRVPAGHGRVAELATVVDAAGTVRMVVDVERDFSLPPPGEGVELSVLLEPRADALTVPERALAATGGEAALYVVRGTGGGAAVERATVELGARGKGRVEVRAGISAGDQVVVSGVATLTHGQLVKPRVSTPSGTGTGT